MGRPAINHLGKRFGRLTVASRAETAGGAARWNCNCDCGGSTVVNGGNLTNGKTNSCGCLSSFTMVHSHKKHGGAYMSAYRSWCGIFSRCCNPSSKAWPYYGGRGIKVCDRWFQFENFIADMGERPSLKHSLDRIDNDRGYEPGNCRWATRTEQANNKRNNRYLTARGVTKTIGQWVAATGLEESTISGRIARGWSAEDAVSLPLLRPGTYLNPRRAPYRKRIER